MICFVVLVISFILILAYNGIAVLVGRKQVNPYVNMVLVGIFFLSIIMGVLTGI